jgi:hypothetical protein
MTEVLYMSFDRFLLAVESSDITANSIKVKINAATSTLLIFVGKM